MKKNGRIIIGVLIVVAVVGYLMASGFSNNTAYYLLVEEVNARADELVGKPIRVQGNIVPDSVSYDPMVPRLEFVITGEDSQGQVSVLFDDVMPDNFEAGQPVLVEGSLNDDGIVVADSVLIQCPSKYESGESNE